MKEKINMWVKIITALIVSASGYFYYTSPFYDAPEINDDDFLLAFKGESRLKGVMRGFGDKDKTRKYLAFGELSVPSWYQDTWSNCRKPLATEAADVASKKNIGPGGRFEAICEIDADGDVFIRGWIVSVPDL